MQFHPDDSAILATVAERTNNILSEVQEIKGSLNELYDARNDLKDRMMRLETEHKSQMDRGGCNNQVTVNNARWQEKLLDPKTLVLLIVLALTAGVPVSLIYMIAKGVIG